ncbi:hypothetical protein STEG23_029317, partial [Scotinomys teguina]
APTNPSPYWIIHNWSCPEPKPAESQWSEESQQLDTQRLRFKQEDWIQRLAGKWMELGNIILSEVTQTQKDKHELFNKYVRSSLSYTRQENTSAMKLHDLDMLLERQTHQMGQGMHEVCELPNKNHTDTKDSITRADSQLDFA